MMWDVIVIPQSVVCNACHKFYPHQLSVLWHTRIMSCYIPLKVSCHPVITSIHCISLTNGPLTRYAKLWVAHAPGMLGMFSPPPRVSDPDTHHGTCVTHVPWCMLGLLTSGFLWSWWQRKWCQHSQRMRNPQFCVSGKRPMLCLLPSV